MRLFFAMVTLKRCHVVQIKDVLEILITESLGV